MAGEETSRVGSAEGQALLMGHTHQPHPEPCGQQIHNLMLLGGASGQSINSTAHKPLPIPLTTAPLQTQYCLSSNLFISLYTHNIIITHE